MEGAAVLVAGARRGHSGLAARDAALVEGGPRVSREKAARKPRILSVSVCCGSWRERQRA